MASYIENHQATEGLKLVYRRFATFGKGHRIDHATVKMESKAFIKFCRDTSLINRKLTQTSLDLIFTQVKGVGQRSVDFIGFLACLEHAALKRGVTYDRFTAHILKWHGLSNDGTPTTDQLRKGPIISPTRSSSASASASSAAPLTSASATSNGSDSSSSSRSSTIAPSTILIVVDMQIDFYSRNSAVLNAFPKLPERLGCLINECRSSGVVEVVHLREGSNPTDSPWYEFWQTLNPGCDSSADANLPEACAQDVDGERIFVKYGYDGVGVESGLVRYLDSRSRQNGRPVTILMCGLVTSCCVHMNAAGLFLRGYPTFVVSDACGDRTQQMHLDTLQRESRRCYAVVEQQDVTNALEASTANGMSNISKMLTEVCWPNMTQLEKGGKQ